MLDVKKLFTKILDAIRGLKSAIIPTNMFSIQMYETANNLSLAANTNYESTLSAIKAGYYPLGIVSFHTLWVGGSTATMNWYSLKITSRSSGAATISYAVRNESTATVTWRPQVWILWAKE